MKKIAIALAALAVMAAVVSAAVYSQNAVGFINKKLEAGKLYALAMPFSNMDSDTGNWVFATSQIGTDAPLGSQVYFWSDANQAWSPYVKNKLTKKWTCGNTEVKIGECFFFRPAENMEIATIAGEVPDDVVPVNVLGSANMSAIAVPYPVTTVFTNTALATDAGLGARVYFWSVDNQAWSPFVKNKLTKKWTCGDASIAPGDGFFFRSADGDASATWEEMVPYDFPNVNKQ